MTRRGDETRVRRRPRRRWTRGERAAVAGGALAAGAVHRPRPPLRTHRHVPRLGTDAGPRHGAGPAALDAVPRAPRRHGPDDPGDEDPAGRAVHLRRPRAVPALRCGAVLPAPHRVPDAHHRRPDLADRQGVPGPALRPGRRLRAPRDRRRRLPERGERGHRLRGRRGELGLEGGHRPHGGYPGVGRGRRRRVAGRPARRADRRRGLRDARGPGVLAPAHPRGQVGHPRLRGVRPRPRCRRPHHRTPDLRPGLGGRGRRRPPVPTRP